MTDSGGQGLLVLAVCVDTLFPVLTGAQLEPAAEAMQAGRIWAGSLCANSSRKMQLVVYKLKLVTILEASDSGAHNLGAESSAERRITCKLLPLGPKSLPSGHPPSALQTYPADLPSPLLEPRHNQLQPHGPLIMSSGVLHKHSRFGGRKREAAG